MKTLDRKIKKDGKGGICVTSTVETTFTMEYLDQQEKMLLIHQQKAHESLENIERQLNEIREIKEQLEDDHE